MLSRRTAIEFIKVGLRFIHEQAKFSKAVKENVEVGGDVSNNKFEKTVPGAFLIIINTGSST